MKRPEFDVKAFVKVINSNSQYYGWRGTVVMLRACAAGVCPGLDSAEWHDVNSDRDWLKSCYEKRIDLKWSVTVKFPEQDGQTTVLPFLAQDIETVQHKFIDIQAIRETDIDIGNGAIRPNNVGGFEAGDHIQISEKIDGANASVAWCPETGKLEAFSRTNLLTDVDGLRGFKSFIDVKIAPKFDFSKYPRFVFFGEWCVRHHIVYRPDWENVWRLYDIWDKDSNSYLPQVEVRKIADEIGVEYIHALYDGPFISWEHCRSFLHKNTYGDTQEGIVVKNQDKLDNDKKNGPAYIKIVNDEFKESTIKQKRDKTVDPVVQKEIDDAKTLIASVVTEARVRKTLLKFIDEGLIPREITPACMGVIVKNLGKRVFEDLMKEEPEIMAKTGSYAGKFCSSIAINIAKRIAVG